MDACWEPNRSTRSARSVSQSLQSRVVTSATDEMLFSGATLIQTHTHKDLVNIISNTLFLTITFTKSLWVWVWVSVTPLSHAGTVTCLHEGQQHSHRMALTRLPYGHHIQCPSPLHSLPFSLRTKSESSTRRCKQKEHHSHNSDCSDCSNTCMDIIYGSGVVLNYP